MITSARQLKDKIRNLAKDNSADAQLLMRLYMIERFLERISESEYRDNFILKGGALIASMAGIRERSTMDLDTTLRNYSVGIDDVRELIKNVIAVDVGDGVSFRIKSVTDIMDEAEYPGVRVSMDALFDGTITAVKVDVSTGDVITPGATSYHYPFLLEERGIDLWAYPLETVLAEKIESIISKAGANTRMRDYYDVYLLSKIYQDKLDMDILNEAISATAKKRGTQALFDTVMVRVSDLREDRELQRLWSEYSEKYPYAQKLAWLTVMDAVDTICGEIHF